MSAPRAGDGAEGRAAVRRRWPTTVDYATALKGRPDALVHPDLTGMELRVNTILPGKPLFYAAGNVATVFQGTRDGRRFALRVFNRDPGTAPVRYRELDAYVKANGLAPVAATTWLEQAVAVGGEVYPALSMEWIEGRMLHRWVEDHLGDRDALVRLTNDWLALTITLADADFAHGDLQIRNVMVTDAGELRLVDLDGVWIPPLTQAVPNECGHPNFQHPARFDRNTWHREIDAFSALVVYVSLRALAQDPGLWSFFNEENLIFHADDFAAANAGTTPVWAALGRVPDPDLHALLGVLRDFCWSDPEVRTDLARILAEKQLTTVGAPATPPPPPETTPVPPPPPGPTIYDAGSKVAQPVDRSRLGALYQRRGL